MRNNIGINMMILQILLKDKNITKIIRNRREAVNAAWKQIRINPIHLPNDPINLPNDPDDLLKYLLHIQNKPDNMPKGSNPTQIIPDIKPNGYYHVQTDLSKQQIN